jgi:type VI protein secretion system component Hcp
MDRETHERARMTGRARRRLRAPLKVLVPTVAALGAGGAVAVASIPGPGGTINACYVTSTTGSDFNQPMGALRVIDPSAGGACNSNEAPITWNQQGPAGPQGAQGPQGQEGPAGPEGPAGTGVEVQSGPSADVTMDLSPQNDLGKLKPTVPGATTSGSGSQTSQVVTLSSFSLGAQNSTTIGSATSGAGAGKAQFQKFEVVKEVDKASSTLFQDLTTGKFLSSVEIVVRQQGPRGQRIPLAQYLMKQVFITDIHWSGGRSKPTETIQGEYGAFQFVIYQTSNTGTTKVGSAGGWNQVTNSPEPTLGLSKTKRHR